MPSLKKLAEGQYIAWSARISHGSAVEVNGERICNVDTMATLERHSLVKKTPGTGYWDATEEGRKLSPLYQAPDPAD